MNGQQNQLTDAELQELRESILNKINQQFADLWKNRKGNGEEAKFQNFLMQLIKSLIDESIKQTFEKAAQK